VIQGSYAALSWVTLQRCPLPIAAACAVDPHRARPEHNKLAGVPMINERGARTWRKLQSAVDSSPSGLISTSVALI